MKLKGTLEDPKLLCELFDLCRATQRTCTLCLQSSTIRVFSTGGLESGGGAETGVQVWVECRTNRVFKEFRCQSPYNNALVCDVLDTKHLCHVLKNADKLKRAGEEDEGGAGGYEREVRLSKSTTTGQPLLKLSFKSAKGLKHERYDIPIRLRSQSEIEQMQVPALNDTESVHVQLPHLGELAYFIDTVKGARCSEVSLEAKVLPVLPSGLYNTSTRTSTSSRKSGRGREEREASLAVEATHDYAHLRLFYSSVPRTPPPVDQGEEEEEETESGRPSTTVRMDAKVAVPLKKFAPFLAVVRSMEPSLASMHLVHERALVFCFCHARCANIAAYIPAILPQVFQ